MKSAFQHKADSAAPLPGEPDEVRAALERICASPVFARSPRHQRLLRYLVDETLGHRLSNLREIHLGVHIFGRPAATFDPGSDTIVRVEARRLRARLQRYYDGDGRDDALQIILSAGSYVPTLRRLQIAAPELRDDDALPVIAVLPLDSFAVAGAAETNDAPSSDAQVTADGLTEALTDCLARAAGVRVVARTSVMRFRGARADIRDIARQLGADLLVEGSLQQADGRWRAVVQVIAANDGLHLWSDSLSSAAGDRFQFFDQVSDRLLRALPAITALLHEGDEAATGASAASAGNGVDEPQSLAALDDEVRDMWERGRMGIRTRSAASITHARELFAAVVERAPQFARGHASLAAALLQEVGMTLRAASDVGAAMHAAVQRALALDPALSEAHATLGMFLLHHEHDWPQAERAFLRAIHFGPNGVSALRSYAFALAFRRRFEEAERLFARARRLDPLDAQTRVHHGLLRFYQRRTREAVSQFADLLATDPSNVLARTLLAASHLLAGDHAAAEQHYREASLRHAELSIGPCGLAVTLARDGRRDEALAARAQLSAFAARQFVSPYQFAMIDCALGEHDSAMAYLQAAAASNDYNFQCSAVDPSFDALRARDDWRTLMQRYGLPAD